MGGQKSQPPQFITPPPPQIIQAPPPQANLGPAIQQNAADLYKAQLEFNPRLTAQAAQLQQQYGPQLAASQVDIQRQQAPRLAQSEYEIQQQYGPLYRTLYEQLFPTQVRGQETLAQQALQRLQNPQALTPEQQVAQDAIRQRNQDLLLRGIRTQANLGGNLYSGNRELQEQRGLAELATQQNLADIQLQQQQRAQALQELIASSQVVFPQVQQPGAPQVGTTQFGQGVTPSPDALLAAILQGQIIQPAQFQPGTAGTPGFGGGFAKGAGMAGGVLTIARAKALLHCLPGTTLIDTKEGQVPIEEIVTGAVLMDGSTVVLKQEYVEAPTPCVKLILDDWAWVETCDQHLLEGRAAKTYHAGDRLNGRIIQDVQTSMRTLTTYDLLTDRPDGGYASCGIFVHTMIPTLHKVAKQFQEMA